MSPAQPIRIGYHAIPMPTPDTINFRGLRVLPIVRVDDKPVGSGVPGPVTRTLLQAFLERAQKAPRATTHAG